MSFPSTIKPLWWLWVPILLIGIQIVLEIIFDASIMKIISAENGPQELFEFLIIGAAAVVALRTLREMDKSNRWLVFWIGLAAACCLYVAIEEISWGQSILKWNTPEFWLEVNKQKETNFHNMSDWLDQKPRIVLQIGILVGGLIIPFLQRFKPQWVPARFNIIYPPAILAVTAGIMLAFRLTNLVGHHIMGFDLFTRPNEVLEVFMYYFVLLYLIVMRERLVPRRTP